MATSDDRRDAILLLLDDRHRQDSSRTVDDTEIAEVLDLDLFEVRRQLDILEKRGLTNAANTSGVHSAWISASGMEAVDRLRDAKAAADPVKDEDSRPDTSPADARSVWVVSGRNTMARAAMFAFLRALGLEPVEWDQAIASAGEGSPFVGDVIESLTQRQAIVVMLTGDDIVQLHPALASPDDEQDELTQQLQPRPNVLFEAGMALGNGRTKPRTILVQVGKVKLFSNIEGRHVVKMNNTQQARNILANRLKTAGCAVNTVGLDWLDTGDFESCTPEGTLQLAGPEHEEPVPEGLALEILRAVGDATAGRDQGIGVGGVATTLRKPVARVEHEMEKLVASGYLGSRTSWQKPRAFHLTRKAKQLLFDG
ncbi:MAG TPA: TIR domain-containing protein [Thermoanaerobaculia bacterium]|nr:TIR domain-containing protein [Thermoanaerobaculia bacterium]